MSETISLGSLISQANDPPQTSKEQHNMINSLCEIRKSLKSIHTSSSHNLESNVSKSSKIDDDINIEVQSPNNPIWDSLFSDQFDSDFTLVYSPRKDFLLSSPRKEYMIFSSPKREYMISSPKKDYMFSSPKRDYMISSPKRDYMISSPKRDYMLASPRKTNMGSTSSSVYTQSPLHRVFNSSTSYSCSVENDVHRESLVLPSMDTLLNEYMNFDESKNNVEIQRGIEGMSATLLECINYENGLGLGEELGSSVIHDVVCEARACQGVLGYDHNEQQEQDNGMQLVHVLLACAESIAKEDYNTARSFLLHLSKLTSPVGDSMQRVASCFVDALYMRLSPPIAHFPPSLSVSLDTLRLYQILYQACPYVKFAHFTANQAIFEALEFEDRVHVIDLDILQGYQWPAFLQALAARPQGPPTLRITGIGYPAEIVNETGRHLAELAHSLRVPFEFHAAVVDQLQDLRPHMLHRRVGEALAVNSVNKLHRVSGPHLGNLLAMIRDQAPNIVTLVEQEASHNSTSFLSRFLEALHYYSAIFDSLDATFPSDSSARAKVEQCLFLPEIRNIVGCEGVDRVERHEKLEKWRRIMEGKGFGKVPLSQNALTQSEILLSLYSCDGYRISVDDGCLLLGWQDRAIVASSAWRC